MTVAVQRVEVWLPLEGEDVLAGQLFVEHIRNRTSASFRYAPEYLSLAGAYSFDPAFQLNESTQVHPQGGLAGAFSDSQSDISDKECNRFRHVFDSRHLKAAEQAIMRS